ncbi:hypothetical protein HanIR_Chr09g0429841 [Helianthus annuus]|nr:hypothetical protein HanIR_Chr09g0429841 [Helianthus annuus]
MHVTRLKTRRRPTHRRVILRYLRTFFFKVTSDYRQLTSWGTYCTTNFHLSQMSPLVMVRVRHFEFLCRAHGIEPTVEKLRAFYQLQRTMGFFSFASRGAAKKILLNPPKSFHDWKPKFFFIREEVPSIAMPFRDWSEAVLKEDLPIPKNARWYQQLTPTLGKMCWWRRG